MAATPSSELTISVTDVRETGKKLGTGSYGEVVEVFYLGTACAAKRIHVIWEQLGGKPEEEFKRECEIWSRLRHPNVVQLLGLLYKPSAGPAATLPTIVMEKMDCSLRHLVETRPREVLPLTVKIEVLYQVTQGLAYLHGQRPPVVHRDLSPNNILVNCGSMTAKLSDFGVARVFHSAQASRGAHVPGTHQFMPPETFPQAESTAKGCSDRIDVFSFGCIIICAVTHMWPEPLQSVRQTKKGKLVALTEVERRQEYLDHFDPRERACFSGIVNQCLEYTPAKRPKCAALVEEMRRLREAHPLKTYIDLIQQQREESQRTDKVISDLKAKENELQNELKDVQSQLRSVQKEKDSLLQTLHNQQQMLQVTMASSRQEYFILRNDVPIVKTKNFLRHLLSTQITDLVLKGELLVKEAQSHDGSHATYSLALDKSKKVQCISSDVAPLDEDDYAWLVAIQKCIDRCQVYSQRDKLEAVKKLQLGDKLWVSLPFKDGPPSQLPGSSCCQATVRYIGPLQEKPGRWVGVELKENRGSSDGMFRGSRYFMCEDGYGAFLSANHILSASTTTSAPPFVATTSATPAPATVQKRLLLSDAESATEREFCLNDNVVVFDKDGKRVPGVVKWASPGKEYGLKCHIIGMETDILIKRERVQEHISGMGHFFTKLDYKKHTYLAIPEQSVLKEGEGTPVDLRPQAMDTSSTSEITNSVLSVATGIALESKHSTTQVIKEQAKALQESEEKKEKEKNEKLAKELGITPNEIKAQQEQYKKLKKQQSENEQRREVYPGTMKSGATGDDQEHFAGGQGGEVIQEYRRSPGVNRRHPPSFQKQTSEERQAAQVVPFHQTSHSLEVGTAVELVDPPGYGIIRWIGKFPEVDQDIAGVEMDNRIDGYGDGSWRGERHFTCSDGHGLFVVLSKLKPDNRFVPQPQSQNPVDGDLYGKSEVVELCDASMNYDLWRFIGPRRGIQGHQNSCYLDATLFAMFGLTNKFDGVLCEEPKDGFTRVVKQIMCEEIVYPLRRNGIVRYNPVMKLKVGLDKLNKVKGLTQAEEDPEEFLNLLFKHVLDLKEPFITLKRPCGLDTEFFFQLFLEPSDKMKWTVGEMLHKSMEDQQITFAEVPDRLIIQLPRYGKAYKVYETVYPESELDISGLCLAYVPQGVKCAVCGKYPTHRCQKWGEQGTNFHSSVVDFYCESCAVSVRKHSDCEAIASETTSKNVTLKLTSVVCIDKNHYVCFAHLEDEWVFFDSMAVRTDDQYNIPEITSCPEVGEALKNIDKVMKKDVSELPPLVRRLVKDASLCFYAYPHADMY